MNIEDIREYCLSLKGATEDIKWESSLCFCIGEKMFCVVPLSGPLSLTFKVTPEEFDELCNSKGFAPAPYLARAKWVVLKDLTVLNRNALEGYIKRSYEMIKAKLPKKNRN